MSKRILDMHAHLAALDGSYADLHTMEERMNCAIQELKIRRSQNTAAFFSCGTLQEWGFVEKLLQKMEQPVEKEEHTGGKQQDKTQKVGIKDIFVSFGIHPWYSDQYPEVLCPSQCEFDTQLWEAYTNCDAVGEIGMDSVWCDIPLETQRKVFVRQLQIAEKLNKPIILHTKGQEQEIAQLIQEFPGNICVHWYSGSIELLEPYIRKGCWFTLGPDLCSVLGKTDDKTDEKEPNSSAALYEYMLTHIPSDRLWIETDGSAAVAWALGKEQFPMEQIPSVLQQNLEYLAKRTGRTTEEAAKEMQSSLERFLRET